MPHHSKMTDETIKLGDSISAEQQQAIIKFFTLLTNQNDLEFFKFLFDSLIAHAQSIGEDCSALENTLSLINDQSQSDEFLKQIRHLTASSKLSENLTLNVISLFDSAKYLAKHSYDDQLDDTRTTDKTPKEPHKIILPVAKTLIRELSKTTDSYNKQQQREQTTFDRLSAENKKQEEFSKHTSDQQKLVTLLQQALNNPSANFQLTSYQLKIIKRSLGEENFNFLIQRYNLIENNFTLDDLRMLIVGVLPNSTQEWMGNDFIKNLFICCNIEQEWTNQNPLSMQTLREKINIDSSVWNRIANTPHDGIINKGLDYLKTRFSDTWKLIVPTRFKSNSAFKRDLDTALSISTINSWQNKPKELQEFAANEFLFHKLSCSDLKDGAVVPILEADGSKHFYKVKNLIDETSIHGFALIPVNSSESLDIKVVFKSSTNLAKEIIDTENYVPHQEFKRHKGKILQELNKVTADFKKTTPTNQHKNISFNIGGHGTGGTLAQHLINELITDQASIACRKQPSLLEANLDNNVEQQCQYELDCGKKIKHPDAYQETIKKHALKYLTQTEESVDDIIDPTNNHLRGIHDFQLSTVNSGGVPAKMRNNFIQALSILKKPTSTVSIKCNKIMAGGDPVQQTGATDLAAYIPPNLMPTTLLKFNTPQEGSYKDNLMQIAKSSALLVIQAVVTAKSIVLPIIAPLIALINPKTETENIINNVNSLIDNARHAHKDCHFNQQTKQLDKSSYQIMSNELNNQSNKKLNKELSTKIPVFNSKPYKELKKAVYNACTVLHQKLQTAKEQAEPVVGMIDNAQYSAQIPLAQQALHGIQTFIEDPRGKTKLLTSSLLAKASEHKKTPEPVLQTSRKKPQAPAIDE